MLMLCDKNLYVSMIMNVTGPNGPYKCDLGLMGHIGDSGLMGHMNMIGLNGPDTCM